MKTIEELLEKLKAMKLKNPCTVPFHGKTILYYPRPIPKWRYEGEKQWRPA